MNGLTFQASTLTQNVTDPIGQVTTRITGPAKILTVLQIFLEHYKKKRYIKFTDNIYFYLFHLHLFLKHLGTFLRGNL